MNPSFAENQNKGSRTAATIGTRNTAAAPRKTMPNTGNVRRSNGRAGFIACEKQIKPTIAKMMVGMNREPYSAGKRGCHPPRNKSVATADTVIILQYSAMKNAANFMLAYSVWKPATNSFSASGRSNGMRLVSAKAAMMNRMKLMMLKGKTWK